MKIATLRKYARDAAQFRGHAMPKFHGSSDKQYSRCVKCGMQMSVVENPGPNEIYVSGEAVALCCPGKEKK